MEEDKLKDLFGNFDPPLSSDFKFMSTLKENLERVEMIRQHNEEIASRRKKAVAVAACVGFITGFLFSLALPYIGNAMMGLQSSLPAGSILKMLADNYLIAAWIIIGATAVFISMNAYDLSLSLLKHRATSPGEPTLRRL